MILGSGLVARAFAHLKQEPGTLIFASGVSNSSSATEADYDRERALLSEQEGAATRLVYFSTCSLFDPALGTSGYIRHKWAMEALVRNLFPDHLILRLPNVVGHTPNPHTLTNHIRNCLLSGDLLTVQTKACRYLMGADMAAAACTPLILSPALPERTVNVCLDKPVPVPTLVAAMEKLLGRKALTKEVETGSCYSVDNSGFKRYWTTALTDPWPDDDHWQRMLACYYGNAAG